MNLKTIALGAANIQSKVREKTYVHAGLDLTRPVQVYGLVTSRCNLRCIMCDRKAQMKSDLPAETWQRIVRDLKKFSRRFNLNFSGGEPLVRDDFLDILEFCTREGVITGFTTNGVNLTEEKIKKITTLDLYNLNISLDGISPEVNDRIRNRAGVTAEIKANLDLLLDYRRKRGSKVNIMLKTVVSNLNLHEIDALAGYAGEKGVLIHYQPVETWSEESKKMRDVDPGLLRKKIAALLKMKKNNYPILNSEGSLRSMGDYFLRRDAGLPAQACVVPLRTLMIESDGTMYLCIKHKSMGNVQDGSIGELWQSEAAKKMRRQLAGCTMNCNATCYSKKDWKYYLDMFKKLL